MKLKICFPYFYQSYHAYHSSPIGFELSRLDSKLEIKFITTTKETYDLLCEIGSYYNGHRCSIKLLKVGCFDYYKKINFNNLISPRPKIPYPEKMIRKHREKFKDMDVIIDTNYLSLRLKKLNNNYKAKYVMAYHGAVEAHRTAQNKYNKLIKSIDFFLVYGPKRLRSLKEKGCLSQDNWSYFGYPKFDITLRKRKEKQNLFQNNRPIVLYNPHFEPNVSSWFSWGKVILDYFVNSEKYNLIFAPHVELKGRSSTKLPLEKYLNISNIHIDLGSKSSINMTYTKAADLYLGDVSSQIIEYLVNPRPCIFLNSHKVLWKDNLYFSYWKLGYVLDCISELDKALSKSFNLPNEFESVQREYFSDSIQLNDTPSGLRAAKAILKFLR